MLINSFQGCLEKLASVVALAAEFWRNRLYPLLRLSGVLMRRLCIFKTLITERLQEPCHCAVVSNLSSINSSS